MSNPEHKKRARAYWRSLEEWAGTAESRAPAEEGFVGQAPDLLESASRREFLRLMGASAALAGVTACRWPAENIVPFANRPEGRTPGVALQFATAIDLAGAARGLLVTSYDGRPIKIEGNPSHPQSLGATDAIAQAAILELYDPDRAKRVERLEGGRAIGQTWWDFSRFANSHFQALRSSGGQGLRVLSEACSSPSLLAMRGRLLKAFPQAVWHEYEPVSADNERIGARLAFGRPCRTHLGLDRAEVIVSLDADILMGHPAALAYARDFASGRRADDGRMNRLYVVESVHSVTGSMADHRLATLSKNIGAVACRLGAELQRLGLQFSPSGPQLDKAFEQAAKAPVDGAFVAAMARDLMRSRGRCAVAVGPRQPAEVHALAHLLNSALGAAGQAVRYTEDPDPERPSHVESIRRLAEAMDRGEVNTLLILGGNPLFDAPADLEFGRRLAKSATSIHLSLYLNETSQACQWRLPRAHWLESWGDARSYDGALSVIQPLIEPFYEGRTPIEVLALVLNEGTGKGYDIVRETLRAEIGEADFEGRWRQSLDEGIVAGTRRPDANPAVQSLDWAEALGRLAERASAPDGETLEIVFCPDSRVHDGRFANNGWLQELPDPMTKLTWGNAAMLSPATAQALGVTTGDWVRIHCAERQIEAPAFVLPGQARGSVSIALGYGRKVCGRVGGGVGVNACLLRTSAAMDFASARIEPTGRRTRLAVTQDYYSIDALNLETVGSRETQRRLGRLIREATLSEYLAHPDFAQSGERGAASAPALWKEHAYEGRRWGMAIDLTACIGCAACVAACQAENNIPVVGKKEVARGRGMLWLRIDRYFSGRPEAPRVARQPVACHHCENAPCEQVCPVAATLHGAEGLNEMVYNRCIGARYCSNNCPYKVRRFNFFNNHKRLSDMEKMAFNPEVTIRCRGVMEKCTYCVQRINAAKIAAKNERRALRDGEIVPACAQACPTQAIVFGDLSDPKSRVAQLQAHARAYGILEELNLKPRTKYLAKIRNPSPDMAPEED